jgi:hypothetical protein
MNRKLYTDIVRRVKRAERKQGPVGPQPVAKTPAPVDALLWLRGEISTLWQAVAGLVVWPGSS